MNGVNAITGQTAATQQSGYVLSPHERAAISGWRKSDQEVAAFYFTALPDSYAARTGRPDDVGVIGLAVYREKTPLPLAYGALSSRADNANSPAPATAPQAKSTLADAATERTAKRMEQKLGTGHGERIDAPIEVTQFERDSSRPNEIVTLRYESRSALIALGVIPRQTALPRAFPNGGYVPDPS